MRVDSDIQRINGTVKPENFKAEDDPRVTKVGHFIRRFDIDELPQFFQIVLNQMTLFGTRPVLDDVSDSWSEDRYNKWKNAIALAPKAGLSGLNQVLNRNPKDEARRYNLDVFYAVNASLGFDIYLIWRTALRVLKLNIDDLEA